MEAKDGRRPIVVGYDSSSAGQPAFDWALQEAERRHVPLHLMVSRGVLYAAAPTVGAASPWPYDITGELVEEARSFAASRAAGVPIVTESAFGSPASVLLNASREAAMVVVGRRHHTVVGEAVAGSTSAQVVAHASCPVVVVDQELHAAPDAPIVVAVDGSPSNGAALAFAFERAAALKAGIVAVHAWWLDVPGRVGGSWLSEDQVGEWRKSAQAVLDDALSPWAEKFPDVSVRRVLTRDLPVDAVLAEAQGAQLIVVGSRGHGGFAGLLVGSVSQGLLHHERPCPLAVVHPEG
ncbi:universal stress protein [Pedococcus bigeumensis]|uniref:universal stress protein n=1 Tax=Pedococcus bigeumensis TaxID=433644 RepID=UPI002FEBB4AE